MSHRGRNTPFKGTYPDNSTDRSDTGSRLRPVSDSLEAVGFPSKGDKTLLDHKAQRTYYDNILKRYMQFCSSHSHDLEAAWASLPANASADATRNPPSNLLTYSGNRQVPEDDLVSKIENLNLSVQQQSYSSQPQVPMKTATTPSAELSTILMSLRKLREGILATSSTTPIAFQQQVLIFSIRFAILARHPPSYFSSLRYLLNELHTNSNPLAPPILIEFTSYLILDYACRQHSLGTAYTLLIQAKQRHTSQYSLVHQILNAFTHDNWISFMRIQREVDGYVRAVMAWAAEDMTRQALKAAGRTYLTVNVNWLLQTSTSDRSWTWQRLAEKEKIGWRLEGDTVIIKKPRTRT